MKILNIVFGILGGLGVFLYGLFILSFGFKKIYSKQIKKILENLTKKPVAGAFTGFLVTSIVQSSSLVMVTLIGLLNAGFLGLKEAISVMLGAEIGTTITAQIVAFKIGVWWAPITFLGAILYLFGKEKTKYIGQVIFGFGLVFLGMILMSQGAKPLKESQFWLETLSKFGKNPILGVVAASIFTAIIQSSSATMGLIIALGSENLINLPSAISLMLGANIGTCITGAIASIRSSLNSKRLAFSQLTLNILGTLLFLGFFNQYVIFVSKTSSFLPRQIANSHTIFNIICTILGLLLLKYLIKLVKTLLPGKEIEIERGAKFIDEKILHVPSIAIYQAEKEILRMGEIAKEILMKSKEAILKEKLDLVEEIKLKENMIDELHHIIDNYLTKISALDLSEKEAEKVTLFLHTVSDIERVGDHCDNFAEFTEMKIKNKIEFSKIAQKEIEEMFEKCILAFSLAIETIKKDDKNLAKKVLEIEEEINNLERKFQKTHYQRLKEGICKPEAGPLYLEILANLERVGDHSENIASGIIMGV